MAFDFLKCLASQIIDSLEYQNEYGTPSLTMRGEKVKSKGEKLIADYFYLNKINYEYEKKALTDDFWLFREKISKPDFYLPDYNIYVEYWGLYHAKNRKTRNAYRKSMSWKIRNYKKNNIMWISLYADNITDQVTLDRIFRYRLVQEINRK